MRDKITGIACFLIASSVIAVIFHEQISYILEDKATERAKILFSLPAPERN
jgi:hypothetical protein